MVHCEINFFATEFPRRYNCPLLMDFKSQGQHIYCNSGWLKLHFLFIVVCTVCWDEVGTDTYDKLYVFLI